MVLVSQQEEVTCVSRVSLFLEPVGKAHQRPLRMGRRELPPPACRRAPGACFKKKKQVSPVEDERWWSVHPGGGLPPRGAAEAERLAAGTGHLLKPGPQAALPDLLSSVWPVLLLQAGREEGLVRGEGPAVSCPAGTGGVLWPQPKSASWCGRWLTHFLQRAGGMFCERATWFTSHRRFLGPTASASHPATPPAVLMWFRGTDGPPGLTGVLGYRRAPCAHGGSGVQTGPSGLTGVLGYRQGPLGL